MGDASPRGMHGSHWGAFEAVVEAGRLVAALPFAADPAPSPILGSIPEGVHHRTRVRAPAVRRAWLERGPTAGGAGRGQESFVEVDWDTALDLVAGELTRVRTEHGNAAIFAGSYGWASAGRFHHARTQLQRLLALSGGYTGQVQNYSFAAALTLLPHILGGTEAVTGPVSTWDGMEGVTGLMVAFGGIPLKNSQVDSGGLAVHTTEFWLRRLRRAGTRFVNISPLRDDAPEVTEARWIAIRPNTDTALMLGLAHTLVAEGLHHREFLERYCTGWERFASYLTGGADGVAKSAGWAAGITGVPADTIRELARQMAASRTMISTAWSLQRADHGEQPFWMTVALAAILGQIGLPGGGFGFGYGDTNRVGHPVPEYVIPRSPGLPNPEPSFIPVARIADMLLNPGAEYEFDGRRRRYPEVRLVYWAGGNPFHHHQDLNRLREAWRRPETVIVHEPWWTATARHADIVLPATTTLERNDIGASSGSRHIIAMHRAIEPQGQALSDFEILTGVARRLGVEEAYTEGRDEAAWLRHLYEAAREANLARDIVLPDFDRFWEAGYAELPAPTRPHVYLAGFRADPEANPLPTPSGRIEIFSERIAGFGYADCPGHPTWLEPAEWLGADDPEHPLHMVSNQPRTRLHSQYDPAGVSAAAKVQGREPCRINPADAAARGIQEGDVVRIFNRRGACLAGAVLSEAISPGVIQLSTGAWFDPQDPEPGLPLEVHGNPNVLTRDAGTSRLSQGPSAQTARVQVERYDPALPEIRVFSPPEIAGAR